MSVPRAFHFWKKCRVFWSIDTGNGVVRYFAMEALLQWRWRCCFFLVHELNCCAMASQVDWDATVGISPLIAVISTSHPENKASIPVYVTATVAAGDTANARFYLVNLAPNVSTRRLPDMSLFLPPHVLRLCVVVNAVCFDCRSGRFSLMLMFKHFGCQSTVGHHHWLLIT